MTKGSAERVEAERTVSSGSGDATEGGTAAGPDGEVSEENEAGVEGIEDGRTGVLGREATGGRTSPGMAGRTEVGACPDGDEEVDGVVRPETGSPKARVSPAKGRPVEVGNEGEGWAEWAEIPGKEAGRGGSPGRAGITEEGLGVAGTADPTRNDSATNVCTREE